MVARWEHTEWMKSRMAPEWLFIGVIATEWSAPSIFQKVFGMFKAVRLSAIDSEPQRPNVPMVARLKGTVESASPWKSIMGAGVRLHRGVPSENMAPAIDMTPA